MDIFESALLSIFVLSGISSFSFFLHKYRKVYDENSAIKYSNALEKFTKIFGGFFLGFLFVFLNISFVLLNYVSYYNTRITFVSISLLVFGAVVFAFGILFGVSLIAVYSYFKLSKRYF